MGRLAAARAMTAHGTGGTPEQPRVLSVDDDGCPPSGGAVVWLGGSCGAAGSSYSGGGRVGRPPRAPQPAAEHTPSASNAANAPRVLMRRGRAVIACFFAPGAYLSQPTTGARPLALA